VLADGTYPTYIDKVDVKDATITVDVIQLFENEAAINAAVEDGMSANDAQYLYVYIRNQNPRLRTLPVARNIDIEFTDGCEAPPVRDKALTELAKRPPRPTRSTDYPCTTTTSRSRTARSTRSSSVSPRRRADPVPPGSPPAASDAPGGLLHALFWYSAVSDAPRKRRGVD